jgi:hypothetical protein
MLTIDDLVKEMQFLTLPENASSQEIVRQMEDHLKKESVRLETLKKLNNELQQQIKFNVPIDAEMIGAIEIINSNLQSQINSEAHSIKN